MISSVDIYILSSIVLFAALFPTGLYQRALAPIVSRFIRSGDSE